MADPNLEILAVDDIPPNSFLLLRVDVAGPMEKHNAAKDLAPVLSSYSPLFRQKNITILLLTPKEDLNVLTEEEMNMAGWYRKEI